MTNSLPPYILRFPLFPLSLCVSSVVRTCSVPQRDSAVNDAASAFGDDADDCEHRWYDIQELREHYRDKCKWNAFTCPMDGCGHMGRVDTAAEHYETAHGPCIEMTPADDEKYEVTFKIWLPT